MFGLRWWQSKRWKGPLKHLKGTCPVFVCLNYVLTEAHNRCGFCFITAMVHAIVSVCGKIVQPPFLASINKFIWANKPTLKSRGSPFQGLFQSWKCAIWPPRKCWLSLAVLHIQLLSPSLSLGSLLMIEFAPTYTFTYSPQPHVLTIYNTHEPIWKYQHYPFNPLAEPHPVTYSSCEARWLRAVSATAFCSARRSFRVIARMTKVEPGRSSTMDRAMAAMDDPLIRWSVYISSKII